MVNSNHYPVRELSPKALSYFMLIVGLIAIVVSVISQNLLIAASIICFPIILIILIWGSQTPRFGYLLYATYSLSHLQEYKSDVNFHADRFAVILFLCIYRYRQRKFINTTYENRISAY